MMEALRARLRAADDRLVAGSSSGEDRTDDAEEFQAGQPSVDWSRLVIRVQDGDEASMEELYNVFSKGIRFYLCRHLGPQELDDKVHDTFLIVVQAIRRGELREPSRLMGFVRTVVRRQIAAHIDRAVHHRTEAFDPDRGWYVADGRRSPEEIAMYQQKEQIVRKVLRELSRRDREILTRFYLHEQSQAQICEAMNLTDTQFRLLKSRAKGRFGELGRRMLVHKAAGIFC